MQVARPLSMHPQEVTTGLPLENSRHSKGESSLLTNKHPPNVFLCRDAMQLNLT